MAGDCMHWLVICQETAAHLGGTMTELPDEPDSPAPVPVETSQPGAADGGGEEPSEMSVLRYRSAGELEVASKSKSPAALTVRTGIWVIMLSLVASAAVAVSGHVRFAVAILVVGVVAGLTIVLL